MRSHTQLILKKIQGAENNYLIPPTFSRTVLIFTSSVEHTANSAPMYDIYGHAFNCPGILRKKAPIRRPKQEISSQDILSILPDYDMAANQYAVFHMLSEHWDDQEYLKDFKPRLWTEKRVLDAYKLFQTDLREVELAIIERNNERVARGEEINDYLLPQNIPIGLDK